MTNHFDIDLDKNPANYMALSPLSFIRRSATVYAKRTAIVHGDIRFTYAEFYDRSRQLASASRISWTPRLAPAHPVAHSAPRQVAVVNLGDIC